MTLAASIIVSIEKAEERFFYSSVGCDGAPAHPLNNRLLEGLKDLLTVILCLILAIDVHTTYEYKCREFHILPGFH